MKDEVTDILYICSAVWPFPLVHRNQEYDSESKLRKVFTVPLHTLDLVPTHSVGICA